MFSAINSFAVNGCSRERKAAEPATKDARSTAVEKVVEETESYRYPYISKVERLESRLTSRSVSVSLPIYVRGELESMLCPNFVVLCSLLSSDLTHH